MTFLKPALLAVAAVLPLAATATTTHWVLHSPLEVGVSVTSPGSFEDLYLFGLLAPHAAVSTAVSNNLGSVLGIVDGMVTLYRETGVVDQSVGSFAFDDATGSISHDFGTLAAGEYYYAVEGIGTGSAGGFYTISSAVSAVPEPEPVAMMLAGLGLAALLVSRRRSQP